MDDFKCFYCSNDEDKSVLQKAKRCHAHPQAGVERQEYKIKSLHLTPLKVTFAFSAHTKVVRKACEDEKINEKWAKSQMGPRPFKILVHDLVSVWELDA